MFIYICTRIWLCAWSCACIKMCLFTSICTCARFYSARTVCMTSGFLSTYKYAYEQNAGISKAVCPLLAARTVCASVRAPSMRKGCYGRQQGIFFSVLNFDPSTWSVAVADSKFLSVRKKCPAQSHYQLVAHAPPTTARTIDSSICSTMTMTSTASNNCANTATVVDSADSTNVAFVDIISFESLRRASLSHQSMRPVRAPGPIASPPGKHAPHHEPPAHWYDKLSDFISPI